MNKKLAQILDDLATAKEDLVAAEETDNRHKENLARLEDQIGLARVNANCAEEARKVAADDLKYALKALEQILADKDNQPFF